MGNGLSAEPAHSARILAISTTRLYAGPADAGVCGSWRQRWSLV